jgi:tetratricopeptide (TPR) repeat protein
MSRPGTSKVTIDKQSICGMTMSQKKDKAQRSKTLISSMLALSIALSGIFVVTSQEHATALTKDGLAPLKEDAQFYRRQAMEFFASGKDSDCFEFYQKAIDQAVKDLGPTSSYVSDLYFEMGCAAKQRAKFPTAEHCFLEALKHRPNSIPARLQLASVYTSQGKRDEAFAQIKAAKVKNPHSPQAQGALVAYIQGMNRPAEAAREASLIKSMLPNNGKSGTTNAAPGVSHFNGLTELKAPPAKSKNKGKEAKSKNKETKEVKETVKASATDTKEKGKESAEPKTAEIKTPATTVPVNENRMPASLGSSSVLKGLMHGTVKHLPQPAAAPIVTPVTIPPVPVPTPVPPKVDDKELELAKAKAQLEMMRKKLEAAEHDKASKDKHDAHNQSKHNETAKKHEKHPAKSHNDAGTDVAGRAAVLQTKAVIEKQESPKKRSGGFNKVQSNVPSDKSSGDSSRSDGGGENVPKGATVTSDLRHVPPPEGVNAPQYIRVAPSSATPSKPSKRGGKPVMVPPPPPTPVYGSMPIMQAPPMMQAPPKPIKKPPPKVARPTPHEEDTSASSASPSPKASEDDTKFLLDWGGAGEKHKRAKAKDKE